MILADVNIPFSDAKLEETIIVRHPSILAHPVKTFPRFAVKLRWKLAWIVSPPLTHVWEYLEPDRCVSIAARSLQLHADFCSQSLLRMKRARDEQASNRLELIQ